MGKKMIMRKLLSCFVVFAILMSAMPVSVFALNYDNASKDVSNHSNSNSRDSLSLSSNIIYALDNSTISDPKPDLVIIDIWRSWNTIYYKIKNQGIANAGDSYTSLTVEGIFKASDYVAPLKPGAERTGSFTYNWTYTPPVDNITICANYQHLVTELNEANNCKLKTFVYPPFPSSDTGGYYPLPAPGSYPPAPGGYYSSPALMPAPAPIGSNIGFSTGGAKDINNFRENIKNDYLPLPTDVTYEGLFYDYYFDTGEKEECLKLFCPSYSYAISNDPFSEEEEYYLSVGLNSGIKESDFQRKKLNLVIVLDISGSMRSSFSSYYYDRFGNRVEVNETEDAGKAKIEIATEAVVALLDHLEDDDRFGMVLFNTGAGLAEPVSLVGAKNMQKLKGDILEISATGGTRLSAGMRLATDLFDEFLDINQSEYENRIIFLTDAMPNLGETSEEGLLGMTENKANNKVYTTFIGIGVDFKNWIIDERDSIEKNETVIPSVNSEDGIIPPIVLGRWERQSIPLRVSEPYKELFKEFTVYFEEELNAIGDNTLSQEVDILNTLSRYD